MLLLRRLAFHERHPGRAIKRNLEFHAVTCRRQYFYRHLLLDRLSAVSLFAGPNPGIARDRAGRGMMATLSAERVIGIKVLIGVVTHVDRFFAVAADLGGHFEVRVSLGKEVASHPIRGVSGAEFSAGSPWTLRDCALGGPASDECVELFYFRTGLGHLSPGRDCEQNRGHHENYFTSHESFSLESKP